MNLLVIWKINAFSNIVLNMYAIATSQYTHKIEWGFNVTNFVFLMMRCEP